MSDSGSKQPRADIPFALVVTGFGIGWLAGLSVSPVVSIVITSVTGSVATIIAALSGVKEEFLDTESSPATLRRLLRAVTPVPLAWLVGGLILGSIAGIGARNYNLLGPKPATALAQEVNKWTAYGLDEQVVARRLFEAQYGYRGLLEQNPAIEITRWTTGTISLDANEVAHRLFESTYPLESAPANTGNALTRNRVGCHWLYCPQKCRSANTSGSIVYRCPNNRGDELRAFINDNISIQQVISLTQAIPDDQMLKEAITVLCTNG
ncbi:MAG: hypothetical protein R3E79_60820 [Caldilineaceae bacterium]